MAIGDTRPNTDPRLDDRPVTASRSNTGAWILGLLIVVGLIVAAFAFGLIDLDADAGKVPDVNVTTSGGEAPSIDASVADVDVGTKSTTVEVPTVDVSTRETAIEVPTVDVAPAADADAN